MEAHGPLVGGGEDGNGLFPFQVVRDGQRQFLEDARSCVRNRVNLLAHAPTGMGKTAVALSAALESTLMEDGLAVFMTSRQSQHNVAVETSRHIWRKHHIRVIDLISREDSCLCKKKGEGPPCLSSSECYFNNEERIEAAASRLLDYPLHVTEAQRMCLRMGACPWRAAMKGATWADVVVCDYNHMFAATDGPIVQKVGRDPDRTVLVIDEAHNLPGRIIESCSCSLSRASLQSAMRMTGDRRSRSALHAVLGFFDKVLFEPQREIPAEELESALQTGPFASCQELAEEIEASVRRKNRKTMERTATFLRAWNANGSSSFRYADPSTGEVHCRYLEPWLVAAPVIEASRCAILMSGTLHPPEMFADLLGIGEMCACRRYRSPFEQGNRNLLTISDVTSRFDRRGEEMYASIASRLAEICSAVPGNVAAFVPSYEMMASIESALKRSGPPIRMIVERRDMARSEKDAIMISLRNGDRALLLATISGSFAEGVDFPDNLLEAVAVVGLPLPPPSIESEEMVRRLGARYGQSKALMYVRTYPAVIKVLQASGRAIRGENDRASIILMDERYRNTSVRTAFPEDFSYAVSTDLTTDLNAFHQDTSCDDESVTEEEASAEKGY